MRAPRNALPVLAAALVVAGCGGGASTNTATTDARGRTIAVPADQPTIQAAVDAAGPGDLVLISPGVYSESVNVTTDRIVIRGLDRNRVILDGGFTRSDGIVVTSDGVAVENVTIRRYLNNGLIFNGAEQADGTVDPTAPPIKGWRGSYITAHNNSLYGVYAFQARDGRFDHIYASGHADSGIYIGQCKPCNGLVTDSVAEANTIGYEGTNSSTVTLIRSVYRGNRVGITSNSQDRERVAPSQDVTIAGNLVTDNNNPKSPAGEGAFGYGIAIGGSERVQVLRNRVTGNAGPGIVITDLAGFAPSMSTVAGNIVERNGTDLALYASTGAKVSANGSCFEANRFDTSFPPGIQAALSCGSVDATVTGIPSLPKEPPGLSFRDVPAPGPQPNMPDAATAPAEAAVGLPGVIDLASVKVPPR
jgi:nitrous oxidase accessory protein NosD